MTKHAMDHTPARTGTRLKHFLRLSRTPRETWHRPHTKSGVTRVIQFLRIARGREA